MFNASKRTLEQLKEVLTILPSDSYSTPCKTLSEATIGQHTRHIIELYQCAFNGYDQATVCYDKRKRDKRLEIDKQFALVQLETIQGALIKPNKELIMEYYLNGILEKIGSNYFREVMYNLEHTIHHKALIKVGINELTHLILPASFGLAPSTLQYREQCVR